MERCLCVTTTLFDENVASLVLGKSADSVKCLELWLKDTWIQDYFKCRQSYGYLLIFWLIFSCHIIPCPAEFRWGNINIHLHFPDTVMAQVAELFPHDRWRHNGRDGVSNYQLTIVYSTIYSDADQRKHQSSASLAYVRGVHRGPLNSPHKCPVTRKMSPFDDVVL